MDVRLISKQKKKLQTNKIERRTKVQSEKRKSEKKQQKLHERQTTKFKKEKWIPTFEQPQLMYIWGLLLKKFKSHKS